MMKLKKWKLMRTKMRCWARFLRILRVLKANEKEIALMKKSCPGGKLPHWTLVGGRFSTNNNYINYYVKRHYD